MAELIDLVVDGRKITLNELLDIIETADDDDIPDNGLDVAVLPPINCNDDVTDEDSGEEDNPTINNLHGSQLCAEAVLVNKKNYHCLIGDRDKTAIPEDASMVNTKEGSRKRTTSGSANCPPPKRKKAVRSYNWIKSEVPTSTCIDWPSMVTCIPEKGKTPLDYFRYFIDEEVIKLFVEYTNLYAEKHNREGSCTENEILTFIGTLLLSGYIKVPRKHMYWQSNLDSHNTLVADSMSRNRFQFIMSNLHVCDNDQLSPTDKFAKIRPLLDMLNERFMKFSPHEQNHSVDESMVPYFGSHSAKQFIRGKPIRFGMKFWCGGTSSGYLSWLDPYQGAHTGTKNYQDKGLGYGVVMTYVDQLPPQIPFRIYFDNLFTSFDLLNDLRERNIEATGTIRTNRIDKSCSLTNIDVMKKKERGSYEYVTDHNSGVCLTRWNDNSIVTIATNFDSVHPVKNVRRFSRAKKKNISVTQPKVLHNYNQYMGGIDRADQNISLYRCGLRGKKWYFPLLTHLIDVSEQNAWQLYNRSEDHVDHLAFRRRLACSILESNKRIIAQRGRVSQSALIDSRYDGKDHYVCNLPLLPTGKKQQLVCRKCSKKATTKCIKCNVTLHVDCFINYHKK